MRTYNTVKQLIAEMDQLYRNTTGMAGLNAEEVDIVRASIIDAYQLVLLEYGMEDFRFHTELLEVNTVADQNYIDLDKYVFRVDQGTVLIKSEGQNLNLINEREVYAQDPEVNTTGVPTGYAYASSDDPDTVRLILWPIPEKVYTVQMRVYKYPSDTMTEFPTALASAIRHKTKALSCLNLGSLAHLEGSFERMYESIITKIKDSYTDNGPKHVQRLVYTPKIQSIEGRIS